jgi:hypothetical protein
VAWIRSPVNSAGGRNRGPRVARDAADCSRTPQHHSSDSVGVSLLQIRHDLADDYATEARFVVPERDGADAMEMSVHAGSVLVRPAHEKWS